MPLPNEDSSMVNGLGHSRFEDECLKATLEEVLNGESQDVIELVLSFIEETVTEHPP